MGEASRGTFFPTHAQDLLEAAVLSEAIADHNIEQIHPVECPLDVLAQVITSMVGMETWDTDRLYAQIKTCFAYRNLSRWQF